MCSCAEWVRACMMLSKIQMCINLHVKLHMNFRKNLAYSSTEMFLAISQSTYCTTYCTQQDKDRADVHKNPGLQRYLGTQLSHEGIS